MPVLHGRVRPPPKKIVKHVQDPGSEKYDQTQLKQELRMRVWLPVVRYNDEKGVGRVR